MLPVTRIIFFLIISQSFRRVHSFIRKVISLNTHFADITVDAVDIEVGNITSFFLCKWLKQRNFFFEMEVNVGDVVMPGDSLRDIVKIKKEEKETVILGPGLRREDDTVLVCKAGLLKKRDPAVYYVDSYQKRYIPSRGENVVGIVMQKSGDIYKIDIGASEQATLSYLAFEGATKKNRPDLQIGDVVYAKLLIAGRDMEPELVCVDSQGKENELGVLGSDGMIFTCSLSLVRKLLNPDCPLFKLLGRNQAYEIAAGMNGRIWIKAQSVQETIAVANAILAAEYTLPSEMQKLCTRIEKTLLLIM